MQVCNDNREKRFKSQTLMIHITNVCEDLDSTVEKTNYEKNSEKNRQREQKIAFMEKLMY